MALITDYASLQASIAGFLKRSDLTDAIPEFIQDAEARIYNDLRLRFMETAYTGTTGAPSLPADFLEWIYLYVDADTRQKLTRKDAEWIVTNYPAKTGTPKFFARDGDSLMFGPAPSGDFDLIGRYYARPAALSDSNTSNWLIVNAPDLLRYGAMCEAAIFTLDDERAQLLETKYQTARRRVEHTEKREAGSGSLLSATRG